MAMPFTEDTLVQQTTAEYLRDELGWEAADCFYEIECAGGSSGYKRSGRGKGGICWILTYKKAGGDNAGRY